MNEVIEDAFDEFEVDGVSIPVSFLRYGGDATTYITYQQTDANNALTADNELINYVDYYDFDIYSKGNYMAICEAVKEVLTNCGFLWEPSRSSADMYEDDTGYYHKTLSFAIERSN